MKMYELTIEREISSAHFLRGYDGKCANLHGHNNKLTIHLASEQLNKHGMVIDPRELEQICQPVIEELDHTHLNETVWEFRQDGRGDNPTAENIAKVFYERLKPRLKNLALKIELWENDRCGAIYYTDPIFASQ